MTDAQNDYALPLHTIAQNVWRDDRHLPQSFARIPAPLRKLGKAVRKLNEPLPETLRRCEIVDRT